MLANNKKTKFGITFSVPALEYLGLDSRKSLKKALVFKFSHIRIGAYWNRIEKEKGIYDLSELTWMLEMCEAVNQPVVLTLGVKAPRWPEFQWPEHISIKRIDNNENQKQVLNFISHLVKSLGKYKCISHWQIENEPLDPSGPLKKVIPLNFLRKEVECVRNLDKRDLIITLWGNDLMQRNLFPEVESLADIIGIDLYPKEYVKEGEGKGTYKGPSQTYEKFASYLKKSSKTVWVTELQAEPWERSVIQYKSRRPKSMSPTLLMENISIAKSLPTEEIFFWGFEYWLWKESQGDMSYLELIKKA